MTTAPGPSQAGIYDYLLDGGQHSAADRAAAEQALAVMPGVRLAAQQNRAFLQRAVRYTARHGVRQYLDIGSGFPASGPVHEVAAEIVAGPHVVYVDNDPAVIAASRELLRSAHLIAINHDFRRPADILGDPAVTALIDWSQPVAIALAAVLHFVPDEASPGGIIASFRERLAPGSYLILSHGATPERPAGEQDLAPIWARTGSPATGRTRREIEELFTGFELVPPGLVPTGEWGTTATAPVSQNLVLAGVGRLR
jgi:SAM-dependent methyltransferase